MSQSFLRLAVMFSAGCGLPLSSLAAESSTGSPKGGPVLIAPQNETPPSASAKAASSRRHWLAQVPAALPHTALDSGPTTLPFRATVTSDCERPTCSLGQWGVGCAAEWCAERLKKALIDGHVDGVAYNCNQQTNAAGPRLLPPQQARPLLAAADAEVEELELKPDEPAKVILDIREQVGPKLFKDTIFDETGWRARTADADPTAASKARLVQCIREMASADQPDDKPCEAYCQPLGPCTGRSSATGSGERHCEFDCPLLPQCNGTACGCTRPGCPGPECQDGCCEHSTDSMSPAAPSDVTVLRQTSRQLDALAEQLEDQQDYDRADELRALGQQLRHVARGSQARATVARRATAR